MVLSVLFSTKIMRRRILIYNNTIDYSKEYLTFVSENDTQYSFSVSGISYSLDDGNTWTSLAANTNTPIVPGGSSIMWKGTITPTSTQGVGTFSSTSKFDAFGNPMSLLYGDNFKGNTSLENFDYAFYRLFYGCTNIVNAKNLSLNARTLSNTCYREMFQGCSSLISIPSLPASTLQPSCYRSMYNACTSLVEVPKNYLPALTLTDSCYKYMFFGCTSLVSSPELPATTLEMNCYERMFSGCRLLVDGPSVIPAETMKSNACLTMFTDCISLTKAPDLMATTLASACYREMFSGCLSLNYIMCLANSISASNCTSNWVRNVASSGTFVKTVKCEEWTTGNNGIPTNWVVKAYEIDSFFITPLSNISLSFSNNLQYSYGDNTQWFNYTANTT